METHLKVIFAGVSVPSRVLPGRRGEAIFAVPGEVPDLVRSERPTVLVMPGGDLLTSAKGRGESLLDSVRRLDPGLKVLAGVRPGDRATMHRLLQSGVFDTFDPDDADDLRAAVGRALQVSRFEEENAALREELSGRMGLGLLVGATLESAVNAEVVERLASADAPVLILGEPGTGKALLAAEIHRHGARAGGPFVTLSPGAVPGHLLEREIFGEAGGRGGRKGRLELARGGTLFVREVGDLPREFQEGLLRALRGELSGHGGGREDDARVVCSSAMDLEAMVRDGSFEGGLLAELGLSSVAIPPLRDRRDDIPVLARLFLLRAGCELGREPGDFDPEALAAMESHGWPGNVRELENRVKRAAIVSRGPAVTAADLGLRGNGDPGSLSLKEARRDLDVRYIRRALQKTHGNISRAAVELGITRVCLHDLLNKYSLRRP